MAHHLFLISWQPHHHFASIRGFWGVSTATCCLATTTLADVCMETGCSCTYMGSKDSLHSQCNRIQQIQVTTIDFYKVSRPIGVFWGLGQCGPWPKPQYELPQVGYLECWSSIVTYQVTLRLESNGISFVLNFMATTSPLCFDSRFQRGLNSYLLFGHHNLG